MRVLAVSNIYPPHFIGGYELGCFEAIEALREHGHEIAVLTSSYKTGGPRVEGDVYRWLSAHSDFAGGWLQSPVSLAYARGVVKRETVNRDAFLRLVESFKPEVVYFWNLGNTSISLLAYAERLGIPTACYVFDDWLEKWGKHDQWCRLFDRHSGIRGRLVDRYASLTASIRGLLRPPFAPNLTLVQFASVFLKQGALTAGRKVEHGRLLHWGVDVNKYPYREATYDPKKLLFVGQITPHKGVHTLIEAMRRLIAIPNYRDVQLSIAGGSVLASYEAEIRSKIDPYGLQNNVKFLGLFKREEMPSIYREHDILVFPSEWQEPFGITIIEAMSSGLAVVCTATGGSKEITTNGLDALHFSAGDPDSCVAQLRRLLDEHDTFERIRRKGRQTIEERFQFSRTIGQIEADLGFLARGIRSGGRP